MDSEPTTNRKGFLKRAGLAIAGVFAVSSMARATRHGQADTSASASTHPSTRAQDAAQDVPSSAMARVRTAKGAVARKA